MRKLLGVKLSDIVQFRVFELGVRGLVFNSLESFLFRKRRRNRKYREKKKQNGKENKQKENH